MERDKIIALCSMNLYWKEISQREDSRQIAKQELMQLLGRFTPMQILLAIGEWAEIKKEQV